MADLQSPPLCISRKPASGRPKPSPGIDYSTMMRSAHSTREVKIAGVPNFAPQYFKSASVTPRAREQPPQGKTLMPFATIFSRVSFSGGQPTGKICSAVA